MGKLKPLKQSSVEQPKGKGERPHDDGIKFDEFSQNIVNMDFFSLNSKICNSDSLFSYKSLETAKAILIVNVATF